MKFDRLQVAVVKVNMQNSERVDLLFFGIWNCQVLLNAILITFLKSKEKKRSIVDDNTIGEIIENLDNQDFLWQEIIVYLIYKTFKARNFRNEAENRNESKDLCTIITLIFYYFMIIFHIQYLFKKFAYKTKVSTSQSGNVQYVYVKDLEYWTTPILK